MSRIDYSKWDKMDFSDDDESSSSSFDDATPRITRLDEPSRLTVSPKGATLEHAPKTEKRAPKVEMSTVHQSGNRFDNRMKLMVKNGASHVDPVSKNKVWWSQDRGEVIIRISYNQSIASRDIKVKILGGLNYEDRYASCMPEGKPKLMVSAVGKDVPILEGDLEYNVYFPEGEDTLDWEIDVTDPSRKLIQITLLKAVPMQGLTVWWSRPLAHFPAIDVVSDIEGRQKHENKHEEWKKSWDTAHKLFKEKMKEGRQKHTVEEW